MTPCQSFDPKAECLKPDHVRIKQPLELALACKTTKKMSEETLKKIGILWPYFNLQNLTSFAHFDLACPRPVEIIDFLSFI